MATKPKREMVWIKLRRNVGLHKVGTVVEIEEPIARAYLDAGAATATLAPAAKGAAKSKPRPKGAAKGAAAEARTPGRR